MHLLQITFLAIQIIGVAKAAEVQWTLHKSCYRNKADTADDNDLAQHMIDTVNAVKAWASGGYSKLDESVKLLPGSKGKVTKNLILPLVGSGSYSTAAKDVRDKFKKFADITGPVGQNGQEGAKYYESPEWTKLGSNDNHHFDFIITCRPDIEDQIDDADPRGIPYDLVRKRRLYQGSDLLKMKADESKYADFNAVSAPKIKSIVQMDLPQPPKGGRLRIPESVNFHPLFITFLGNSLGWTWTQEKFTEVTSPNAAAVFKAKGAAKNPPLDIRPIDGLLDRSIIKVLFHEFFHLTYFGRMLDAEGVAYGWANNVAHNNRENPDLLALIAGVIQLRNQAGQQYTVSKEGNVAKV